LRTWSDMERRKRARNVPFATRAMLGGWRG
jgi:hypothetical protein